MGCGRVGATLAQSLESYGHSVAVVDQNPDSFRRLSPGFGGKKVTGIGFDRDTLTQAGIEECYAFAAVSDGDNSNILAARVARENFGVQHVVARIYDTQRAEIYQRLGISTVATVRWTSDQVLRRMLPLGATDEYRDPSGNVRLCQIDVHNSWYGRSIAEIDARTGARTAFVARFGTGQIVTSSTVLQEGDILHVLIHSSEIPAVERTLTQNYQETDA